MAVQTSIEDNNSPVGTLLSSGVLNSLPYDHTQPGRKGWSLLLFVNGISEEYHCNLCRLVLFKPMVAGCGCRFCHNCITEFIRENNAEAELQCPGKDCSEILQTSDIQVDKFAKRYLEKQRIYCENREYGCREEMRLADLDGHLLKCQFQTIECPNGCGQKLLPAEEDSHLTMECTHRLVPCQYCDQRLLQKDIENHSIGCKKLSTPCPNACSSVGINPSRLEEHLEKECPETLVSCLHESLGCSHVCPRKMLKEHLSISAEEHDRMFREEFKKMKASLSEVQLQVDRVQNTASQAGSAPPELTGQVEKLNEMMKKLQLKKYEVCESVAPWSYYGRR